LIRFIDQKFASFRLDLAHQPHFIRGGCRHHAQGQCSLPVC
jgi:hypothetical protein